MQEFLESFYVLKPVVPLTLTSYLILLGILMVGWIGSIVMAWQDGISSGSREFAKVLWQAIVLDRVSFKVIDLYISFILFSIIIRTKIFVEYLPTVASVLMLIAVWAAWIICSMYVLIAVGYIHKWLLNRQPKRPQPQWCHHCLRDKVCYNVEDDDFYCEFCHRGMGPEFYDRNIGRKGEFLQEATLEEA